MIRSGVPSGVIAVAITAALLTGCPPPPPAPPPAPPAPPVAPPPVPRVAFDGVRVGPLLGRLDVSAENWITQQGPPPPPVRIGGQEIPGAPRPQVDKVWITVALCNDTDRSMGVNGLGLSGRDLFTLSVTNEAGERVFTHAEPAGSVGWGAGEVRRYEVTWPLRRSMVSSVPTGEYTIAATFEFGGRLSARTVLR